MPLYSSSTLSLALSFIAIGLFGLLFGILLALLGILAYSLHRSTIAQQSFIDSWRAEMNKTLADASTSASTLRLDILSALSKIDADHLALASRAIQSSARTLASQTQSLSKLLYANPSHPSTSTPLDSMQAAREAFSMDEEAADDARMIEERNRWTAHGHSTPPPTNLTYTHIDDITDPFSAPTSSSTSTLHPMAGLTHEERQRALDKFWADYRAGAAGGLTAAETLARAASDAPRSSAPPTLPDLPSFDSSSSSTPSHLHPQKSEMED